MTNPNSHVKFGSTKKHKKILTGISWEMCLRGEGMNNYWNHEPECEIFGHMIYEIGQLNFG